MFIVLDFFSKKYTIKHWILQANRVIESLIESRGNLVSTSAQTCCGQKWSCEHELKWIEN